MNMSVTECVCDCKCVNVCVKIPFCLISLSILHDALLRVINPLYVSLEGFVVDGPPFIVFLTFLSSRIPT